MNVQQTLLATVAGGAAMVIGGFLIYVLLGGGDILASGPTADTALLTDMRLQYIILLELLTALLIAVVYERWAGIRTFTTGAIHGAWIGALIGLIVQLDYLATTDATTIWGVLFYGATTALRGALAGGVIGYVLGLAPLREA